VLVHPQLGGLTPPPPWVGKVADLTGPGSFIVGNRANDYNFYLGRPVLSFSAYTYGSSHFDCRKSSNILAEIGNQQSYFILRAEKSEDFDPYFMSSYGFTIERLLKGESQLPFVPIYLSQQLAVYKIADKAWPCD